MIPPRAILLVLACAACEKRGTDAQPTASATAAASTAPAPASTMHVTLDGKDMPTTHAMLRKFNGGLQLYVGEGGTCEELMQHVFDGKKKHILVDLGAAESGVAAVKQVWVGPPSDPDPGGTVKLHGDVDSAAKVDVDVSFASKEAKVDAKGTMPADVCKSISGRGP